ncbi:MAG: exodeoxyribonuclease V subunit beta [Desulfotignum sp.]
MIALNPFDLDLGQTTLIEASAGTGKTYTITTLVVRLIAVGYAIDSILVVTFTEAAAAELKLRIRKRLSRVLGGMSSGDGDPADDSADELISFMAALPDPDQVRRRVRLALTDFDRAAIMTIHGFCLQTLTARAFETGTSFDMALRADASGFYRQVCMDYFMTRINDLDPLMLRCLAQNKVTPETLGRDMKPAVSRPGVTLLPTDPGFVDVCDAYRNATAEIQGWLENEMQAIIDVIQSDPGLDKRSYSSRNVPLWLEAARQTIEVQGKNTLFVMTEKGDSLYRFTYACLEHKTKSSARCPVHPFFDACQRLYELHQVMEANVMAVRHAFPPFYDQALAALKQQQGQCFFDDLVHDLDLALTEGPGRKPLIRAVQDQYRACLIDEFQDTDPAQYRIFATLFARTRSRFGGFRPFFMIGDPKQAIYRFRGGDIFAYLTASRHCDQQFTLEKNYRSSPLLVSAVNDLFLADPYPFVFKDIGFNRVGTPDTPGYGLVDDTGFRTPLQFDFLPRDRVDLDKNGYIAKETARRIIPEIVAKGILSDMSARYRLMDKNGNPAPIDFKDMAVLVRTNREAREIQAALSNAAIPCYLSKTGSVFDSSQAVELNDILWAVFRPDHVGFVKAALASSVFGFDPDELAGMSQAAVWQWQDRFRNWKTLWESRGFIAMIQDLLHSKEGLLHPESVLDDRGLTNFYHLVELISQAALSRHLSLFYLLKWYQAQLFADSRDEAADELRLESDRNAVAIVTIHKSKGLEYPMVYLPFLWSSPRPLAGEPLLFHDPDKGFALFLDLRGRGYQGADRQEMERAVVQQDLEDRAEQRRLLYVAVTRASAMCRIFWAGVSGVRDSGLGSLIHPDGCDTDEDMLKDLNALADNSQSIQVRVLDPEQVVLSLADHEPPSATLSHKTVTRQIRPAFQVTSFSALVKGQPGETVNEERSGGSRDEWTLYEVGTDGTGGGLPDDAARTRAVIPLQAFPKGAGAGDFFHAVLENMDFQWNSKEVTACVTTYLHRFGFSRDSFAAPVVSAIQDVVAAPLTAGENTFCLKEIALSHRMTETEFFFDGTRNNGFHPADLFAETVRWEAYAKGLRDRDPNRLSGFLKGFIDLVVRHQKRFYLIDYKSNFLGDTYEDYGPAAVTRAMETHHYVLQYHIYTRALHRYLSWRIKGYEPKTDFGGVLYLFIRGMHPDRPGTGVFFDRPTVGF